MKIPILTVKNQLGMKENVQIDERPDTCAWCHKGCFPHFIDAAYLSTPPDGTDEILQVVFQCPLTECTRLFIVDYYLSDLLPSPRGVFCRMKTWPVVVNYSRRYQKSIEAISPRFCTIFQQAAEAEAMQLNEISGPGFRKALEILIKDYLISEKPADRDVILKMTLMNCIANKVKDANLKSCAERAAWLGNDETHYLKEWKDHDVKDLIQLIKLATNWIDSNHLTKQYEASMTKRASTSP